MALPAGLPPASFRLEGGCLMCSATAAFECGIRSAECGMEPCAGARLLRIPHSALRTPHLEKWSARQELHLRFLGPRPSALATTLRADWRTRRELHPQPSSRQRGALLIELRIRNGWWEALVMLQSSLPAIVCDTGFTDRQPEHLPKVVAGAGITPASNGS